MKPQLCFSALWGIYMHVVRDSLSCNAKPDLVFTTLQVDALARADQLLENRFTDLREVRTALQVGGGGKNDFEIFCDYYYCYCSSS